MVDYSLNTVSFASWAALEVVRDNQIHRVTYFVEAVLAINSLV